MSSKVAFRATNACEFCRIKKIRCDEKRPCTNCLKKSISCNYQRIAIPSKVENNIHILMERLNSIESKLEEVLITCNTNIITKNESVNSNIEPKEENNLPNIEEGFDFLSDIDKIFIDEFDMLDAKDPYIIPLYENNKKDVGSTLKNKAKDDKISFSKENMYSFRSRINVESLATIDLSDTTIKSLINSYMNVISSAYPITNEDEVERLRMHVFANGLGMNTNSCIFLLIMALGCISNASDDNEYWIKSDYKNPKIEKVAPPPGYDYFWLALSMTGQILSIEKIGFNTALIRLLISLYYLHIGQLSDHWTELKSGINEIFNIVSNPQNTEFNSNLMIQIYWVYVHLERNISNIGNLERSSLSTLQESVPLPKDTYIHTAFGTGRMNCSFFMQNILLSNITDKAFKLLSNIENYSVNEVFKIFKKFEENLDKWKQSLPFEMNWESEFIIKSKRPPNGLQFRYYVCYILLCKLISKKLLVESEVPSQTIVSTIYKCISFIIKAVCLFSQMSVGVLNPNITFKIAATLNMFVECKSLINYEEFKKENSILISTFELSVTKSMWRIRAFALHSPFIDAEYQRCKRNFAEIIARYEG
ncbi:uncharacterized protein PRCAT00002504001 [Priceomyces carsonii]|uniref:uncharacterized protein n=1 Tax=Priceomyces carsonii TaxID=28549 RepID=UPI002ED848C8|nr:unnamed protein product [Priceomyces carsonii]